MHKKIRIGETQINALRSAIETRCIYLQQFRDDAKKQGYPQVADKLQNDFCALTHVLDDLTENPWEKGPA
jgi:hypothetical protein